MDTNQNIPLPVLSHLTWLESMEMRRSHYNMSGYPYPNPISYAPMPNVHHSAVSYPYSPYFYQYYNHDPSQYNRKRQRRQAAAVVVESLWNNNTMGRKSTAQPRPKLTVPPRGIGPIVDPNENDVLCGRGGRINSHSGNIKFRDVINARKKEYLAPTTKKLEKAHIAAAIVYDIRGMDPPGRFLKEERDTGLWYDIGDAKAIKKTGQALREDAPDIRPELEGDSSGDDKCDKDDADEETIEKPNATPKPKAATAPTIQPDEVGVPLVNSPRHVPGNWQQASGVASMMMPQDFHAQVAMPPPYAYHVNPYSQQQQVVQQQVSQQQAFEGRTIPIQSPLPQAIYSLPNQFVAGVKNVGRRVTHASRHAMDALSQSGGHTNETGPNEVPADNTAFGRPFYPPTRTVLSSDNTMSTISGISDPISSTMGGSGLMSEFGRGSAISGMSGLSGLSGLGSSRSRGSFRAGSSRMTGLGASGMGRSSRAHFLEAMKPSKLSESTVSARSLGSFGRSLSFDNMTGVTEGAWLTIKEDDQVFQQGHRPETSLLSGEVASGRFSLQSARAPRRDSTSMSITSMSTASSGRWLAGLKDSNMGDDGRSVLSEMSADLHALDLAHP